MTGKQRMTGKRLDANLALWLTAVGLVAMAVIIWFDASVLRVALGLTGGH